MVCCNNLQHTITERGRPRAATGKSEKKKQLIARFSVAGDIQAIPGARVLVRERLPHSRLYRTGAEASDGETKRR
jgi:hypothetical protein